MYRIQLLIAAKHTVSTHIQDAETAARKAEVAQKRAEDIAAGTVQLNGRELFLREPWVFDNTRY